jgi:hypothetical protein
MILAVAALLFQFPVAASVAPSQALNQPVVATAATAPLEAPKPADQPKNAAAAPLDGSKVTPPVKPPTEPASAALSGAYVPPPPAFRPPDEVPVTHRKWWIVLSTAEHSSAGFDAWSTRYALSNGRIEADPIMRPFAGSPAIYGAIQVIPIGLDYVAHRFQRSSGWTRHIWWAPQSVAAATFLFSGSYNTAHTR